MTRPSPLQVLDADMPKWAAGGWKPGDAAGILAALEEAGYVVVERERALDVERLAEAIEAAWDSEIHQPLHSVDKGRGYFQLRPAPGLAARIAVAYSKIAERSEAAEEVERG